MVKRIDDPEVEACTLRAIKDADKPVSVEYIANALGIAWHQARVLVFKLTAEKQIEMLETTNGWLFSRKSEWEDAAK